MAKRGAASTAATSAPNVIDPSRLLSIQSHVVTGFVGNRSATFPLQLLGWDVDVVNTTQLSNHTGYGRWGGMRLDENHLEDVLFNGLIRNGLCRWSRMLTGYTPSPAALSVVRTFIAQVKSWNPELVYLLDPVMGDVGRGYYVDRGCLPIYRELLPLSTIACPNQFEAQELSGIEITSLSTLAQVLRRLHVVYRVPNVVITSVSLPPESLRAIGASSTMSVPAEDDRDDEGEARDAHARDGAGTSTEMGVGATPRPPPAPPSAATATAPAMLLVGSTYHRKLPVTPTDGVAQDERDVDVEVKAECDSAHLDPFFVQFPEVEGYFSGVGDLFSAVVLGRYRPDDGVEVEEGRSEGAVPRGQGQPSGASDAARKGAAVEPPKSGRDVEEEGESSGRRNTAARQGGSSADGALARACELAVAGVQAVLAETTKAMRATAGGGDGEEQEEDVEEAPPSSSSPSSSEDAERRAERRVAHFRRRELRLVQARRRLAASPERGRLRYRAWSHELPNEVR